MHQAAAHHQTAQPFAHSRAGVGAAAHHAGGNHWHWVRILSLTAPLIIGEIIHDPQKRWRWIRVASLVGALASEGAWQAHVRRDRSEGRER